MKTPKYHVGQAVIINTPTEQRHHGKICVITEVVFGEPMTSENGRITIYPDYFYGVDLPAPQGMAIAYLEHELVPIPDWDQLATVSHSESVET